jgi:hypothetical protein
VICQRLPLAGDNDEALKWLEKAFKARRPWILYIGVDPRALERIQAEALDDRRAAPAKRAD